LQKKARFTLELADGSIYPQLGTFDFFNRQVNVSTGAIQITALFPNSNGVLRPGLFAKVTAPVQEISGALLVPQKALVEMQGVFFVSVLQPDDTVKSIPVKLGPPQGQLLVVSGALQPGEKVVVEGVEKARPGMKVSASPYQPPGDSAPAAAAKPSPTASPEATK
jgi:membrane fusion protein (multidrug efflux system)